MIKKTIHNKILGHKVEVTIAHSDKEFDKAIKDLNKIKDIDCEWTHKDIGGVFSYSDETKRGYITINQFNLPEIVHEITHLVFRLFNDRGIEIRLENDEVFAYHMGYYMKEIMPMYKTKKATPTQ